MTEIPEHLISGPKDGINYPLTVKYCGNCTMPIEVTYNFRLVKEKNTSHAFSSFQYCEYYPDYEKCKTWLEKNLPDEFSKVKIDDGTGDDAAGDDEKKRQKRGGKGMMKAKKTKEDGPKKIYVSRAPRGKKKSVTVVTGLSTFGKLINLIFGENCSM